MHQLLRRIYKGYLAGVAIAIGGIAYLRCPLEGFSPFLFPVGLLAVSLYDWELFTGRVAHLGRHNALNLLRMLVLNLLGAASVGWLANRYYVFDLETLVANKLAQSPLTTVLLGIGCGILLITAIVAWRKTSHVIALFLPIAIFIYCGFEHCVANCFYYAAANVPWQSCLPHILWTALGNVLGALLMRRCGHLNSNYENIP